ncbi:hypothetical protein AAHK07_02345 [Aliarcobacter cryaerophilus]|uniref:hypothetical protein n=1 Tax=Aliarcobacter cryaerophilus TaxID=28198 RepID=UPI00316FBD21
MDKINAQMELLALEARLSKFNELDFITDLTNKGLANEIITRLQIIGEKVSYVANQSFQIGKIILMKLWDFIKENHNLSIGFAIGLGLALLSGMLVNIVPFIGTWLSGIVTPLVALITIPVGTLKGHRLDKLTKGEIVSDSIMEDLITIVKKFWNLLVDIFKTLKDEIRI